jgi:uncharacterized protein (DUF427 family)
MKFEHYQKIMKHPKAEKPKKDQESVWDYPRPPKLEKVNSTVEVFFARRRIASSNKAWRILETSHPPTVYIPLQDIDQNVLIKSNQATFCEWKGKGGYYHLQSEEIRVENAAWYYPDPKKAYQGLKDHLAFYPSKVEACFIDGEKVEAQEGDFYGGWITSKIVGPFKGAPSTFGW